MKIRKALLGSVIALLAISCFNPPEYPSAPEIEFESVSFSPGGNQGDDTIALVISFRDGNGDLGLNPLLLEHATIPFHPTNYFLAGNGTITPVAPLDIIATGPAGGDSLMILQVDDPSAGKLVTWRTRNQPGFSFLPEFTGIRDRDCPYYQYTIPQELLVEDVDAAILPDDITVLDTIEIFFGQQPRTFYHVSDTLYYERNPEHYNIEVDFLVRTSGDNFEEFDWHSAACVTYDGRFTVLSDSDSALEGDLTYYMTSAGFLVQFGTNTQLKLRIRIRDRARNLSNTVESPVFTLQ